MKRYLAILAFAAVLLMPAVQADPGNSQGKGQGQANSQNKGQGQSNSQDNGQGKDHGQDQYGSAGKDNHGQVVSECNHRANDRKLKGKERQDFVDWCTDSSERHGFYDWRWNDDRSCYQKADNKGLSGDKRRDFVRRCVDKNTDDYAKKSQGQSGGKNKGNNKD
jgi:hypothetical protein